jgi:hypothetical protein
MAAPKFKNAQRMAEMPLKCRDRAKSVDLLRQHRTNRFRSWFGKLTTNGIKYLPFDLSLSKDLLNDCPGNRQKIQVLAIPQSPLAPLLNCFAGPLSRQRFACNTVLIVLFALLHVADGFITYLGLSFTDVDEVNPLLNYAAGILGLGRAIVLLKLIILSLIAAIFFDRCTIKGRWATVALMLAVVFYSGVVASNVMLVVGWQA